MDNRFSTTSTPNGQSPSRLLLSSLLLVLLASISIDPLTPVAVAAHATFTGLGDLPGGDFTSYASDLSADGSTVVGRGTSATSTEAFRWTNSTGMVGLGRLPVLELESISFGVSGDGSVVVGHSGNVSGEAFRWNHADAMVGLGVSPHHLLTIARGVSNDGSVIVGFAPTVMGTEAFRWTSAEGIVNLGDIPGGGSGGPFGGIEGEPNIYAFGVSADGNVVVGYGITNTGREAFRWQSPQGMVNIGDLPGGQVNAGANAASSDGSVVVGSGTSADGREAFYWTAANGMIGLGDFPGGSHSSWASSVSADGSIVVGSGTTDGGMQAFRWTSAGGMENLRDALVAAGATGLNGWTLTYATAISDDGRTIAGNGRNPAGQNEAWVATFPVPEPSCLLLAATTLVALRGFGRQ